MTQPLALHVPDEPAVLKERWLRRILDGGEVDDVVDGADGVACWLWKRWLVLERAGLSEKDLTAMVRQYRREIWLWLAGERTWVQCCSGLLGRIERRFNR